MPTAIDRSVVIGGAAVTWVAGIALLVTLIIVQAVGACGSGYTLFPICTILVITGSWTAFLMYSMRKWHWQDIPYDAAPIIFLVMVVVLQMFAGASLLLWIGERYPGSYLKSGGGEILLTDYYSYMASIVTNAGSDRLIATTNATNIAEIFVKLGTWLSMIFSLIYIQSAIPQLHRDKPKPSTKTG